jgi:hypothetical protein
MPYALLRKAPGFTITAVVTLAPAAGFIPARHAASIEPIQALLTTFIALGCSTNDVLSFRDILYPPIFLAV